jgi:NarL family two-component system sensor histidine kinase YdfH
MKTDKIVEKESIPFFIIVMAVMIFLYIMSLYLNPLLRMVPAVIIFSAGMGFHTVLHWMFRKFSRNLKHAVIYFCFQSLLAFMLIYYSGEISLIFGLYMALLGEEAGLFRGIKPIVIIVTINVLLIALSIYFRLSSTGFDVFFFVGIIPMILFVIIYVNLYSRQLEARLEAQQLLGELEQANVKLSMSNAKVEELTREKERQRIARELHDTLAQGLSGIILQLEAVTAFMEGGQQEKSREIIGESMKMARETLSEAREVIDDLRKKSSPVSIRKFIKAEVKAAKQRCGISFDVNLDSDGPESSSVGAHLMKIITEGLRNCVEHSGAENVNLELRETGADYILKISDDGRGFEPDFVGTGHYGLVGMRERVQIFDGKLSVESSPGNGTVLTVVIPGGRNDG